MIKRIPFHPWLLASYFPVALLATNIAEVKQATVCRLVVVMLVAAGVLFVMLNLVIRNPRKTGLLTSWLVFLVATYGLIYSFTKSTPILHGFLGHHRVMLAVLAILTGLVAWGVLKKAQHLPEITLVANLFAFYLLCFPIYQIASFSIQAKDEKMPGQTRLEANSVHTGEALPDIYYIILDSYERQDYLVSDFQYDNSDFLNYLEEAGFYVPDCSRSNYAHTFLSLSSTLNMTYIQNLLTKDTLTEEALKNLLVHSRLRSDLESAGYQTVSFDNVHWDFSDADHFYEFAIDPFFNSYLFPIESTFIGNSILKLAQDVNPRFADKIHSLEASAVKDHYLQQQYILDSLDASTTLDSPKFVFAHIEKPHGPYVFESNGTFILEDAFYRDKYFAAINQDYDRLGYIKQIEYLNRRMERFVELVLKELKSEAIIIIQGDHGILETDALNGRMAILNAIYLPGQDYSQLYPSITPVNTFRIILGQFFNEDLELLDDHSYYSYREDKLEYFPVEEANEGCIR